MRTSTLALAPALVAALVLVSCTPANGTSANLLDNPLYAEFYYDDLVEAMVDIELQNPKEVEESPALKRALEVARRSGLTEATEANKLQDSGAKGNFVQAKETVAGEALFTGTMLYLGPDFVSTPGPSLQLYLSKDVDPRSAEDFPAADDVLVGPLQTPYGAQTFVTQELDISAYRSLVLYDASLKRMYGLAQLAK
jgi:hypothetical protein